MATLSYPSQTSLGKRKAVDISKYSSVARFCVVRPSKTSYDEDYHSDSTQDESDFEIDESDDDRSDTPDSSPGSGSSNLGAGVKDSHTGPRAAKRTIPRPKVYVCTHSNCGKAYSRPSRLEEHKRSHTGVRPFACPKCSKSYLRESHLNAHARSHLSASDRPFLCTHSPCDKRFWTEQHRQAHHKTVHEGVKPFECTQSDCGESFSKHHQLRAHVAVAHCPSGTKPFRCEEDGCTKSFATNQKLRTHSKTHQYDRYACCQPSCLGTVAPFAPKYFPTWSALQNHLRADHPPTCPHAECKERTFATQKGLRMHMKVHEERAMDQRILHDSDDDTGARETKRRRGGEVGRDWACTTANCDKAFKSQNALTNHVNITHLGMRPFPCPELSCSMSFGYKHVMQRHVAQKHTQTTADDSEDVTLLLESTRPSTRDLLTGKHYTKVLPNPNSSRPRRTRDICCPWPDLFTTPPQKSDDSTTDANGPSGASPPTPPCAFKFSRAYDLRRHLASEHGFEAAQDLLDEWVGKSSCTTV